jgi:hypothetical protein
MQEIKLIIKDGGERQKLFKSVLGSKQGQVLLAYLEYVYKGKTDLESPNNTYYRLGKRDVIAEIKALATKKEK